MSQNARSLIRAARGRSMYENINKVDHAFCISDAPASRRLCKELDAMGPIGQLASLLFKAQKSDHQAKTYIGIAPVSRRPYRDYSNDRMEEMLAKAIRLLDAHAKAMGISWGWVRGDKPGVPPWVLCIDLPTGKVIYRFPYRHRGPDYELALEDDSRNSDRVTAFCAGVLDGRWTATEEVEETEEDIWG